jgi:hypothetical protein
MNKTTEIRKLVESVGYRCGTVYNDKRTNGRRIKIVGSFDSSLYLKDAERIVYERFKKEAKKLNFDISDNGFYYDYFYVTY